MLVPVESMGYELVEVEIVRKFNQENITVIIDSPAGITHDDCQKVHLLIEPIVETVDPFNDPYVLNVSSPGLDRKFISQRDFERNYGKEVEVKLLAPMKGKKYVEGVLINKCDKFIELTVNGADLKLELAKINFTRPLIKFS